MANGKKIPIDSFDKVVQGQAVNDAVVSWYNIEVTVKHTIGLTDMMEFVHNAAESCFSESGAFVPEVMDFAIKSNILTRYANLTLPDELEHRYALIYESDIVDIVCEHINHEQLQEITSAVKRKVNYACDANVAEIQRKATEMLNAFEELGEKIAGMFSNVSQEDIQKLLGAVSNGGFNEDALVKAYLKQTKRVGTKKAAEK